MMFGTRHQKVRLAVAAILALFVVSVAFYMLAAPAAALRHRFSVGQRLVYRLAYTNISAANLDVLTGEAKEEQTFFTNIEGDLEATVLDADADGARVAFMMNSVDVQIAQNGELAPLQAETIQADLGRMALANVDRRGKICSVHVDPKVGTTSNTVMRTLLAGLQVVLPDDAERMSWDTREGDPTGDYFARCRIDDNAGARVVTIIKEKVKYVPRPREKSIRTLSVATSAHPSGSMTIRFDRSVGIVEEVTGTETTTILVEERVVARSEAKVHVELLSKENLSKAAHEKLARNCAALKREPALALSAAIDSAEREAAIHRNELKDTTLESLLADLSRLDADADPNAAETRLYLKGKALIYLHPEACPSLAKLLSNAQGESRTMRLLTEALSSVGHAEAQRALCAVMGSRSRDEAALAMLMQALAMVEAPTEASEDCLRQIANESVFSTIRAAAELGLGTMAHQLADAEPSRAGRIVRDMSAKLARAESAESRRHYLFVLGNAGATEALDAIVRHLDDSTPEVRAAAVAALRFVAHADVNRRLCETLTRDAEPIVRIEAATALSFREMTAETFAAQKQVFQKDASTSVRLVVLANLARAGAAFPEGRRIVQDALNDSTKEVREEAANLAASN